MDDGDRCAHGEMMQRMKQQMQNPDERGALRYQRNITEE